MLFERTSMAEKKLGNSTYRCEKLKPLDAQRLLIRVGKIFGPSIHHLGTVLSIEDEAERDREALRMIGDFLSTLEPDTAEEILVALCEMAQVKEGTGGYDQVIFGHHMQDLMEAWQVAAFVLGAQFSDFFGAALNSGAARKILSRSPTPKSAA